MGKKNVPRYCRFCTKNIFSDAENFSFTDLERRQAYVQEELTDLLRLSNDIKPKILEYGIPPSNNKDICVKSIKPIISAVTKQKNDEKALLKDQNIINNNIDCLKKTFDNLQKELQNLICGKYVFIV